MINSWRKEKGYNSDMHRVNVNITGMFLFLKLAGGYSDVYIIIIYTRHQPTRARVSNLANTIKKKLKKKKPGQQDAYVWSMS